MLTHSFDSFFDDEGIFRRLCTARLVASRRRHDRQFLDRLAPAPSPGEVTRTDELMGLFPPRSRWIRPKKKQRAERGNGLSAKVGALLHTIKVLRTRGDVRDRSWIAAQDELVSRVKRRALVEHTVEFKQPQIHAIEKMRIGQSAGTKKEYRVLAVFGLEDSIVMGQCASYLRSVFDCMFLDCSFAFRCARVDRAVPTHHDAFDRIAKYWNENRVDGLANAWVAECDIQGFFDCVHHSVVVESYDRAVAELSGRGIYVDARARRLLLAYLRSYSYGDYARPAALALLAKRGLDGVVKDRAGTVGEHVRAGSQPRYGIPQGGALSCEIANLLLHEADTAVYGVAGMSGAHSLYLRYCDDMILLSSSRDVVEQALEAYSAALDRKKLVMHPLKSIPYGAKFWKGKSKSPYRWGSKKSGGVPWVAFVGYHLRFDGQVRIRPASLQKEKWKQVTVVGEFLSRVLPSLQAGTTRRSKGRALASLRARLEAMSVGRRHEFDMTYQEPAECWTAGFKGLRSEWLPKDQWIARRQLRSLDRGRGLQFARAEAQLRSVLEDPGAKRVKERPMAFSGKPHSYAGQLDRE